MGRDGDIDKESGDEADPKNMGGEYSVGDVIWLKISRGLWWPAKIVGGENGSERSTSGNETGGKVRVRVYGSYEYLLVDPAKSSPEFETILKRNKGDHSKIFEKALEQSISSSSSKRQESKPREARKNRASKQLGKHSDVNPSIPRTKKTRDEVSEQERVRKSPIVQTSNTEAPLSANSPQSSARRIRVMKRLGLSAPDGSPFGKCRQTK